MKYDLTKKPTRGARRTLDAFSGAMFELLCNCDFEKITVSDICAQSCFPRATFYNYFDDKFDLLNFCWYNLCKEIKLEEHAGIASEEKLYVFFDRIYDLVTVHWLIIQRILKANAKDGFLLGHFRNYMNNQMQEIFRQSSCQEEHGIPFEIVADYYSNTLYLILEWSFLKEKVLSKEEAYEYLRYLLKEL